MSGDRMWCFLTGDRVGTAEIMRRTGLGKPSVWRWQERCIEAGVDGLLRDKTRPPGIPKLSDEKVALVLRSTLAEPPPADATHWTVRAMAEWTGVSTAKVHEIWQENGLVPHRFRQFKLSRDPDFVAKVEDVVGLCVDPPRHAVVLSIDETERACAAGSSMRNRRRIQALYQTHHPPTADDPTATQRRPTGRRGPGLPMKKRRLGTMTHDYKRNGTTTLFAALDVLEGTVVGQNKQRHRHQEFIQFLNTLERQIPAGKLVHVVLDKSTGSSPSIPICEAVAGSRPATGAAHKHEKVRAWLARHPRWTFHITPTSCSWLNAVEGFFAKLTRRRLKHGVFRSLVDPQQAINTFIALHNEKPKPFVWTADPKAIVAAVKPGHQMLETIH